MNFVRDHLMWNPNNDIDPEILNEVVDYVFKNPYPPGQRAMDPIWPTRRIS